MIGEAKLETAKDGADVWRLPSVDGGTLLVITDDASYTEQLPPDELKQVADEIAIEGVPAEVRLSNALKVPHAKVIAAHGEEKELKLVVAYQSMKAALTTQ